MPPSSENAECDGLQTVRNVYKQNYAPYGGTNLQYLNLDFGRLFRIHRARDRDNCFKINVL